MDIKIARWIGRGLCIGLFIFWGMFFIEHLSMFTSAGGDQPPLFAWLLQIDHGLLLISYLLCLKFERNGSISILIFGAILFVFTGAAWYLHLISYSPIAFFAYAWIREKKSNKPAIS